jgi:hypothetical protein
VDFDDDVDVRADDFADRPDASTAIFNWSAVRMP